MNNDPAPVPLPAAARRVLGLTVVSAVLTLIGPLPVIYALVTIALDGSGQYRAWLQILVLAYLAMPLIALSSGLWVVAHPQRFGRSTWIGWIGIAAAAGFGLLLVWLLLGGTLAG